MSASSSRVWRTASPGCLWAVLLLALACGPAAQQPDTGAPAATGPRYGGQISIPQESDPFDWDVSYTGRATPNDDAFLLGYNTLLTFKTGPDIPFTDTTLQPGIAERWSVSPDARAFTFNLRKGIKFQDVPPVNGRELTSADVKWTLDYRLRSGEVADKKLPKGDGDFMFQGLEAVETPDPYTVVVKFKDRFAPYVNYAASYWNPIFPREVYEQDGHFKDRLIGTGPYILDMAATQKGSRWVFKKNPNYFEEGRPYLDEIRWLILPDQAAQLAAFQAKQLDMLEALRHAPYGDAMRGSPQSVSYKYFGTNAQLLFTSQVNEGPLRDVRVRKAISLAVDRDEINKVISAGEALWAIPATTAGSYSEAETRQLVRQSVEEAKRLLAEAGYASGVDLEWPVPRDESNANMTLYTLVQAQLKRAGINANLKLMDRSEQRAKRRRGDFDLDANNGGTGVLNADIDSLVYARYHSTASQNYSKFKDPELDKLLEALRAEADPAKRKEVHRKVSLRILEMVWNVDLTYPPQWHVWQPHVKNNHPHFTDVPSYRHAWVQK